VGLSRALPDTIEIEERGALSTIRIAVRTLGETGFPPSLARFVADGPPPGVFAPGSAVSLDAGSFFRRRLACAKLLKNEGANGRP
jgi:hypothetical protein